MDEKSTSPTGVKFPSNLLKQIDEEVDTGDFRNRSELIIAAVRDYITRRQELRIALLNDKIKFSEKGEIDLDSGKVKMSGEQKFE
jgi:Arc/MetJ-type ribon-helix-helix transcriptional regulator